MKPETEKLSDIIRQVFEYRGNAKARKLFLEATKGIQPAFCKVKIGWKSGSDIVFNCMFTKNGSMDIFEAVEKGIENKEAIKYFIYGLNPKKFHFLPETVVHDAQPDTVFLIFKLVRNESRPRKNKMR